METYYTIVVYHFGITLIASLILQLGIIPRHTHEDLEGTRVGQAKERWKLRSVTAVGDYMQITIFNIAV